MEAAQNNVQVSNCAIYHRLCITCKLVHMVMRVKHRGMLSPWERDSRMTDPDRSHQDHSGAIPIGYAHVYPSDKSWAEPEHAHDLCSGLSGSLRP
jgi:hypothetical protein